MGNGRMFRDKTGDALYPLALLYEYHAPESIVAIGARDYYVVGIYEDAYVVGGEVGYVAVVLDCAEMKVARQQGE